MRKRDPQCVIAVTHAGVIRVALVRSGKAREATAVAKSIPFGSIHQLICCPNYRVAEASGVSDL